MRAGLAAALAAVLAGAAEPPRAVPPAPIPRAAPVAASSAAAASSGPVPVVGSPRKWMAEPLRLFRTGRLTRAAEAFEAAGRERNRVEAWLNAGVVYKELGRDEDALEMFERAAALRPEDPDVLAEVGRSARRAGRTVHARLAFDEALRLEPGNAAALLGLGRLQLRLKKTDEAIETLRRLAKVRPNFSFAWLFLGRAYEAAGREKEAAGAYERITRVDKTFSEARLALGAVYRKLRNYAKAWRQYAMVLNVEPRQATARREKRLLSGRIPRSQETEPLRRVAVIKPRPVLPAPAGEAVRPLRVGIGTSASGRPLRKKALAFRSTGPFRVIDPETGRLLKRGPAGKGFLIRRSRRGGFEIVDEHRRRLLGFHRVIAVEPEQPKRQSLIFQEIRVAKGFSWSSVRDRQLKGRVEVRVSGGRLYMINVLPIEDYLYGVVTEEMPTRFPMEALEAQAIIARTLTLYQVKRLRPHRRWGYDLCDGQHCQVYGGITGESRRARRAVDATSGLILKYRGRPAQTPYMSNCGGHTQDSGEIQGWTALPYLRGRLDGEPAATGLRPTTPWGLERWLKERPQVYCSVEEGLPPARFRWTRAVSARNLEARANRRARIGRLRRVVVVRRSRSGYANEVWIQGTKGTLKLKKEHVIRRTLGLGSIRSTMFLIETERDPNGRPKEFLLYGGGWGHGVGLCQFGAAGRAQAGQDHRAILDHYYPGTRIGRL